MASMQEKNDEISFSEINNSTSTRVGHENESTRTTTTTTATKKDALSGGEDNEAMQTNDEIQLFDKKSLSAHLNEIESRSEDIKRASSFISQPPDYPAAAASKSTPPNENDSKLETKQLQDDMDSDNLDEIKEISLADVAKRRFSEQDQRRSLRENLLDKKKSNSISESKEL